MTSDEHKILSAWRATKAFLFGTRDCFWQQQSIYPEDIGKMRFGVGYQYQPTLLVVGVHYFTAFDRRDCKHIRLLVGPFMLDVWFWRNRPL
mgnify:CR=1 FL=1